MSSSEKPAISNYEKFIRFVQKDLEENRMKNRKNMNFLILFGLLIPVSTYVAFVMIRALQNPLWLRWLDVFFFLPTLYVVIRVTWPTVKALPDFLRDGSDFTALKDSLVEVKHLERMASRVYDSMTLDAKDFKILSFQVDHEVNRIWRGSIYFSSLWAVVIFALLNVVDFSPSQVSVNESPAMMFQIWAHDLSGWVWQFLTILTVWALSFFTGIQPAITLRRYGMALKRVLISLENS